MSAEYDIKYAKEYFGKTMDAIIKLEKEVAELKKKVESLSK